MLLGGPATGGPAEVEWRLFRITGPKIVSGLSLAKEAAAEWVSARLLVSEKDGHGKGLALSLRAPNPIPLPPCHPGCFPAGTPIKFGGLSGTLATTELQPLSLAGGGLRPAGALKPGDRINSWVGHELRPVKVKSVAATVREAEVYNLVLGEPVL